MSIEKDRFLFSVVSKDTAEDITGQALLIPVYEKEAEFYVLEEEYSQPNRCFLADPVYLADYRKIVTSTIASFGFFPGMAIGKWTELVGWIIVVPGFKSEFCKEIFCYNDSRSVFPLTRLEPDEALAHRAELRALFQKKQLNKEDLSGFGMQGYSYGHVQFSTTGRKLLDQFLVQK